jgi:photosystem II stability/assembly factor-like uncharacterized protein
MLRMRFLFGFFVYIFLTGLVNGIALDAQQLDQTLWRGLKWRSIGPFRGGRTLAVEGVAGNPNVYYFGAVAGGVWKTTDGGVTWVPTFDKQAVSSIGSVAVAPSDSNIVYVGTGEACIRNDISFGDGAYKSVDGGNAWSNIGLKDSRHIGKIIIDPHNADIVFVAALGHAFGSNTERGVFRSTNGGASWQKVLFKDDKTGAIDITFDPTNTHILYAALWEARRTPWSLVSGGPGSGLYKSDDGGTTWKLLEGHGLPSGIWGRVGVSVSGADGTRVYALIEAKEGGLYRSEDGGNTWQRVNDDRRFRQRAWYFTHVFADPKSVDTVYILNTGMFRSTDGGRTFELVPAPHGDHHDLWVDPTNPQRMINGNDGGATITINGGKSWSRADNQPTAQFYHVAADTRFPYYLYGAQQDNSTVAIASRTDHGVIDRPDWYSVGGGESGYIAPDPRDPEIVYAGGNSGSVTRFDKRTGQVKVISPWPEDPFGYGASELKHRLQWTAPLVFSPHDPNLLYHGLEMLFRTTSAGASWEAISPDLSRNDRSKQQPSGGPITKDNGSAEYYDTISTVAESPLQKDLIWVGTDDGQVHITTDGGKTWGNVTPKDLPDWSLVSLIEPSPHDAAFAYMAVDRHKLDDFLPYIYRTVDYGKTWEKITHGLPEKSYVHAVREDPERKGLLYAGTETGPFISFDGGEHWQSLQLNLPTSPIYDLIVKNSDLIVATHGRSFWILDDISPLRQVNPQIVDQDVHIYSPQPVYRFRSGKAVPRVLLHWYGENAPNGAVLNYYLKSVPKDEITAEIFDSHGKLIREFSSKESEGVASEQFEEWPDNEKPNELLPVEVGMNRFIWDLRYQGPRKLLGAISRADPEVGPLAIPGEYTLKLNVAGKSQTSSVLVREDPRIKATDEDLKRQLEFGIQIRDRISEAHDTVNKIRELRDQLHTLSKRLTSAQRYQALVARVDELEKEITEVEAHLTQKEIKASEDSLNYPNRIDNQLSALADAVESADGAPTRQSYEVFEIFRNSLEAQLSRWNEIQAKDVKALNDLLRTQNIQIVSVAPVGSL